MMNRTLLLPGSRTRCSLEKHCRLILCLLVLCASSEGTLKKPRRALLCLMPQCQWGGT